MSTELLELHQLVSAGHRHLAQPGLCSVTLSVGGPPNSSTLATSWTRMEILWSGKSSCHSPQVWGAALVVGGGCDGTPAGPPATS